MTTTTLIRFRPVFLSTFAAFTLTGGSAPAQEPDAGQRRQAVTAQMEMQQEKTNAIVNGPKIVDLGPAGVVGPDDHIKLALGDFDVPFQLSSWFCDTAVAMRDCAAALKIKAQDPNQFVTFTYHVLPGGTPDPPKLLLLRLGGLDRGLTLGGEMRIPLADFVNNAPDGRVNILILSATPTFDRARSAPPPEPLYGISFTTNEVALLPSGAPNPGEGPGDEVLVRLNRTGVASPKFLNPRRPVYLGPPAGSPLSEAEWQERTYLAFSNEQADRQFVVTFSGISDEGRWAFLAAGLQLTHCSSGKCQAAIAVPPGSRGSVRLPIALLRKAYVDKGHAPVVKFGVQLFHDDVELANPTGYFSVVQAQWLEDADNESSWHASVTAQFGGAPDFSELKAKPSNDPEITDTMTRGTANDVTFSGTARIGLEQSLGSRANGLFDLRLKKGDFGTSPTVEATQYRLNVFGFSGVTYSGGLFDIAEPSEGIALSESGENIGGHFRFFDANYIIRKYVPRGQQDVLAFGGREAERNHSATLVQVVSAPWLTWKYGRLDLYGIYGRKQATRCLQLTDEQCPPQPPDVAGNPQSLVLGQWYTTTGGEFSFSVKEGWSGSVALYRSWLRLRDEDAIPADVTRLATDTGQGTVGLATVGWTSFGHAAGLSATPARFSIRGQFGMGTGSTADSDTNDGYLGETASFAPDALFLSKLAPLIDTSRGQVGTGLTNKKYTGVLVTTSRWSLLQYLGKPLRVPKSDVSSVTTTVRLHHYSFNEAVGGHHGAGTELDSQFSIDAPAGLTYSLGLAGFWPGDALTSPDPAHGFQKGLIEGFQWSVLALLSVKM